MNLLNIFALSGLINCLVILGLGIFIISHNWQDKLNRLYFLFILSLCIWSFSYWAWLSSTNSSSALFWVRILSIGSVLIPIFYFHWVVSLLKIEKNQKKVTRLVYMLGFLFIIFSFSNLFISGVEQKLIFPFWPNPGIIYHFYLIVLYVFLIIYSSYLIFKNYIKSTGIDKKRLEYVLIGTMVGFLGGLSNFFLWYDIQILPFGNFLVVLYPLLLGYATIKFRLFNIRVIATELFIIAIWIFLIIKIFLSTNLQESIINSIVFILVLFFGILLIKSVIREVEQREEIAKMAEDVRRAYMLEKKAKDEVNKAYALEKKANEDLEQLDKVKDQFLAQTQHDLRTPLTSIMGYTDLLLRGTFGKQTKKTTEVVIKLQGLTDGMIKKANNFLDLAQFQLGKSAVLLKPGVNIFTILTEIKNELDFKAENKGIKVILEKPKEVILIKADREKLKAAVFNIVDNSVKYTQVGTVTITLESTDKVKVSIIDTGIGIPKEKVKTIFETMFDRTEQAKKITSGAGVGLYLSTQIIKDHKGKVWAESEGEGKGSSFFIEFPLDDGLPVPVAPARPQQAQPQK